MLLGKLLNILINIIEIKSAVDFLIKTNVIVFKTHDYGKNLNSAINIVYKK